MTEDNGFRIRTASLSDCPAIARIHAQALPDDPATDLGIEFMSDILYPHLLRNSYSALVACSESSERVVGFLVIGRPLSLARLLSQNPAFAAGLVRTGKVASRQLWKKAWTVFRLGMRQPRDLPPCELQWIAVEKKWQGQGVGNSLLRQGIEALGNRGIRSVWVRTLVSTPENITFYQNAGFTENTRIMGRSFLIREIT